METLIIYLKINTKKLDCNKILFMQLQKVSDYLIKRNKLRVKNLSVFFGTVDDDFVKNKVTVKITYNLKK